MKQFTGFGCKNAPDNARGAYIGFCSFESNLEQSSDFGIFFLMRNRRRNDFQNHYLVATILKYKKATDFKNQWLFNLVGPPGLEPGTKGL
jgi:hypothetical protein